MRRDITRLREIGYPVEAAPGVHGGYRLGSGGKIPPLLLDDDEAVAMAIGLAAAAGAGSSGLEVAAVSALSKLDRVLPPRLRERVNALGNVTLGLRGTEVPAVNTDVLVVLALACQRPERIRFDYRDAQDQTSHRIAEPYPTRVHRPALVPRRQRHRPQGVAHVPRRPHRRAGVDRHPVHPRRRARRRRPGRGRRGGVGLRPARHGASRGDAGRGRAHDPVRRSA